MNIFFIDFKFHRFFQSGCYFDFFYKKITELFVRNYFIYASQFLGEKYMIEYLTKNVFNKSIFFLNKKIGSNNLIYFDFFYNIFFNFFFMLVILSTSVLFFV